MGQSDGVIVYNFQGIDTIVGAINTFVTDMDHNLRDLESTFTRLLADGWTGPGSGDFDHCRTQWSAGADQLRSTLGDLATRLGNAAGNMAAADAQAGATFRN
jgi:WXG100 family type VII secretion target